MKDDDVITRIDALVALEHDLHARAGEGEPLSAEDQERLREVEIHLDQCWDLLRQRRARRAAGQDPDAAGARAPEVVERYQQ